MLELELSHYIFFFTLTFGVHFTLFLGSTPAAIVFCVRTLKTQQSVTKHLIAITFRAEFIL